MPLHADRSSWFGTRCCACCRLLFASLSLALRDFAYTLSRPELWRGRWDATSFPLRLAPKPPSKPRALDS